MLYTFTKRILDIIFSLLLLVITFPFMVVFSIIVWVETSHYPIYTQKRGIVLEKKLFKLFKLRTLKGLDSRQNHSPDIFIKNDLEKYVTSFGRWLRKTGLDELPQLLNVLFGNMSIIGPRPFSLSDMERMKLTQKSFYERRSKITSKPGITGFWQIYGDRTKGIENLLELEEYYDCHKSLILDLKILRDTIYLVFGANNKDAILK